MFFVFFNYFFKKKLEAFGHVCCVCYTFVLLLNINKRIYVAHEAFRSEDNLDNV